MTLGGSALLRIASTVRREALVCLVVGVPAVAYVLATNTTASAGLIFLHAGLLGVCAPLSVALLEAAVPRKEHPAIRGLLRDVAVRTLGLAFAVVATVGGLAALTSIPLSVLVGGPLLAGLLPVFLSYAIVAMAAQWAGLREHALRAEANEARARQAALAARIRPHFLFNALNGIEELTASDPPAAQEAVGRLSRLLRSVLRSSSSPTARLEDEVRLVDDYLGLEKMRFGERFTYELTVAPEAAGSQIPTTMLLTLAENAVKHGLEAVRGPARISLRASARGAGVRITMTGPAADPVAPRAPHGTGYGLADVRERLELAYAGRARFSLRCEGGEGHVELDLPG